MRLFYNVLHNFREKPHLIPSKKGYTVKAIVSDLKPQSTRKIKKEPQRNTCS